MKYDHKKIEEKWRGRWKESDIYKTRDMPEKPKYYILDMFPYPSGAGLHVGHPKGYIATDIFSRMRMMQGYNILHPFGWDAFGLPAENYAIKNKMHPREATERNIATFKSQMGKLGMNYDWDREINTTDPEFYKWTQWIFLQMFKRGLAAESFEPINWCPSCKTALANEDLEDGKCERCGSPIERRPLRQWVLKITDYAERLLDGLEKLSGWEESIKEMQKNWIGRSEGANVKFEVRCEKLEGERSNDRYQGAAISDQENKSDHGSRITDHYYLEVFTTRPDTLFGCTYMVVAPEHSLITDHRSQITNYGEVSEYIEKAKHKTDLERAELQKEKTGVEIKGIKAVNPANSEEIPIFAADYVLMGYGTGAIMAVPAHDQRDYDFALKYALPIRRVVAPNGEYENQKSKISGSPLFPGKRDSAYSQSAAKKNKNGELKFKMLENGAAYEDEGVSVNSGFLDGLRTKQAKEKMIERLEKNGQGAFRVNYKLNDWVFSRQRYWGEPFPIVYCENCRKKKYDYLLLHGYGAGPQDNFFPWLKIRLEEQGHRVFVPELPNPASPDVGEQVEFIMNNYAVNPDTIMIGHSLGGVVAMKLAEAREIHKLILVDSFIRDEFSDPKISKMQKRFDFNFDFGRIRENCGSIIMLADAEFNLVPKNHVLDMARSLGTAPLARWPNGWHFCGRTEPDILELAKESGWVPLPETELPLELPDIAHYEPAGTGESPLAGIPDWVNAKCPRCGGAAKRETNTMPQWAGSSWYYLAYVMRGISDFKFPIAKYQAGFDRWLPVDFYVGGAEHATRHLIYARFWHKFLFDIGVVSHDEPFTRLQHVGLILAEDGRKMSKRWGNVINPDDVVDKYGADAMRVYEMFMGPFSQPCAWNTNGLVGVRKFLEKMYNLKDKVIREQGSVIRDKEPDHRLPASTRQSPVSLLRSQGGRGEPITDHKLLSLLHKTVKKVGEDIEQFKFNTAVSAMMILANAMSGAEGIPAEYYKALLKILAPFAPHICEELWEEISDQGRWSQGGRGEPITDHLSIFRQPWPEYDPKLIIDETFQLVVQVNGKVRDLIEAKTDISEEEARGMAMKSEKIKKWTEGKEIHKTVYVKGKLLNIVVL